MKFFLASTAQNQICTFSFMKKSQTLSSGNLGPEKKMGIKNTIDPMPSPRGQWVAVCGGWGGVSGRSAHYVRN